MKTKLAFMLLWMGIFFSVQAQLKQVFTANFYLNDMYCINSDTIFVCGNGGKVLKTYDAGASWQKDSLPTKFDLKSVIMNKYGIGYLAGDSGTLFKTDNYGANWDKITANINDNINNLQFYNDSCGYAANKFGSSGAAIYKTQNGGKNWNLLRHFEYLTDFKCFGKDTIYIGTVDGLFYSYNAGIKWDSTLVGEIKSMSWLNDSIGFIAPGVGKTVNAGKSFNGGGYSNASVIFAVNDTILYGSSFLSLGMLYISKTTNGGDTWDINPEFAPQKISFINKDTGYVLYGQKVFKTTNGCIYTYKDCSNFEGVINNSKLTDITIAPNPMDLITLIRLPATCSLAHYKLYNNLGQMVEENTITPTSNQILRGNKPSGIYIFNITDSKNNLISNQKLIIK
jgi:photosystem II stability/assembly factor-like uncharacterized protein